MTTTTYLSNVCGRPISILLSLIITAARPDAALEITSNSYTVYFSLGAIPEIYNHALGRIFNMMILEIDTEAV
jgi:hypothetical protein